MKKTFAYFISIIVVGGTTASSGIQPSPALKGGEEEDSNSSSNSNLRNSISTTGGRSLAKKKKGPKKKGPFDDDDEETGDTCQLCNLKFVGLDGEEYSIPASTSSFPINAVLPKTATTGDGSITRNVADLIPQINATIYEATNENPLIDIEVQGYDLTIDFDPPELIKLRYTFTTCGGLINRNDLEGIT